MFRGDVVKFRVVNFRRRLQGAEDHRPAHLQRAQIALRKRASGEINGRDRKLLLVERPQIICQQPHLLQFRRSRGDGFANICKDVEFGCCRGGRAGGRFFSCRRHACLHRCRLWQREFHLVFCAQRPRLDPAFAHVAREL